MIVKKIVNSPISSNCYVIHTINNSNCIVLDPGSIDNKLLLEYLKENNLSPNLVILTHEHFDHIWGIADLQNKYSFNLLCNQVCANAISNPKKNLSIFHDQIGFAINHDFETVESLNFQINWFENKIVFMNTPGHSDGSICIKINENIFCGDLMIQNKKTITKLPGGSKDKFNNSIRNLKKANNPDSIIYSGHGEIFYFKDYFLYAKF